MSDASYIDRVSVKLRSNIHFGEDATDVFEDPETIHHESNSLPLGLDAKSFYVNWPQQIAPSGTTIILITIEQNSSYLALGKYASGL